VTSSLIHRTAYQEGLEARFARRLLAEVEVDSATLPYDISERLRFAREKALQAAATRRLSLAPEVLGVARGASGLVLGSVPWWLRLASAAPLVVLVLGLVGIGHLNNLERIRAAAEVDAVLLADDLPLAAYSDPGFAEYLKTQTP
jgi:hypothetical protein